MKATYCLLTLMALTQIAGAQNEYDAYRFSQMDITGTARYTAMGGAFSALGGDLSAVVYNPAGLARYSKGEGSFTLLFEDINSDAQFKNNLSTQGKGNFNIGSMGIVGVVNNENRDWRACQFAITYNRTGFYHNRISFSGDHDNSLADIFRNEADGLAPDLLYDNYPNSAYLAYQAYLIDPDDTTLNTYTDRVPPWSTVTQSRTITRTGFSGETAISFSGDYRKKLYLGFSMGFPGIRYSEDWSHNEVVNDTSTTLQSFTYYQSLSTRGLGFNFKGGIIFLPVSFVRIGLAFHSPSFMSMTDNWNNSVQSQMYSGESYSEEGPYSSYSYRLRRPGRIIGSVGVVLMKMVAVGLEAEYVDYQNARLRKDWSDLTSYNFDTENMAIESNFKPVINLKAGIEVKLAMFYLRGGYAIYPSGYNSGLTTTDGNRTIVSGGIGLRMKQFFADFALSHTASSEDIYPYDPVLYNNTPAVINTTSTRGTITFGWRFKG